MAITARHFAKRAPMLDILGETLTQPVEAFGDRLAGMAGQRLRARCRP